MSSGALTAAGDPPADAAPLIGGGPATSGPGRRRRGATTAVVLVALATLPFFASGYAVSTAGRILAFGLLAASLDLLVGITGLPSLGHAAWFGIGGYAAAIVARNVTAVGPAQLAAAAGAAGLAAALTGLVLLRSRGTYFLMLTLAIGQLAAQLAESWTSLTDGSNGLVGVPPLQVVSGGGAVTVPGLVYWYVLAAVAGAYGLLRFVAASPFGRSLRGIRDNERRMRSLGFPVGRYKLAALALAGALAGGAGSLWVTQFRFISPADLGFTTSALALLTVVIGGRGSLWGSFVGAAAIVLVRDELSASLAGRGPLLLGLAFVAVVYLLPGGAAGLVRKRRPA